MQNECKRRKKNRVRPFSAKLTPRDSLSEAWKLDVETANNAPGLEAVCPPPLVPPSLLPSSPVVVRDPRNEDTRRGSLQEDSARMVWGSRDGARSVLGRPGNEEHRAAGPGRAVSCSAEATAAPGGRAEQQGSEPLPAPGCSSAAPAALGGSCGKGEGKGREESAAFSLPEKRPRLRVSWMEKISISPPAAKIGSFWFLYTCCFPLFLCQWVL